MDKIFGRTKFSADKIFRSKSDFRQFCPPKFCPIRYSYSKDEKMLAEYKLQNEEPKTILNYMVVYSYEGSELWKTFSFRRNKLKKLAYLIRYGMGYLCK